MESNKPKRLYKYQSFSTYALRNLKGNILYFNDPFEFNDPYDTFQDIETESLTEESLINIFFTEEKFKEVAELYNKLIENSITPVELIKFIEVTSKSSDSFKKEIRLYPGILKIEDKVAFIEKDFANHKIEIRKIFLNIFNQLVASNLANAKNEHVSNKGICCFSEKVDDLLMWSYYADGHKGFCLEFDTDYEPFSKLHKVNYVSSSPKINPNLLFIEGSNHDEIVKAYLATKFIDWQHEEEWRVVHMKKKIEYYYESNALSGIYFGSKINLKDLEIIALIIKGHNSNCRFYQMKKIPSQFKIEPVEFNYSSFQETKNNIYPIVKERIESGIIDIDDLMKGLNNNISRKQLRNLVLAIVDDERLKNNRRD